MAYHQAEAKPLPNQLPTSICDVIQYHWATMSQITDLWYQCHLVQSSKPFPLAMLFAISILSHTEWYKAYFPYLLNHWLSCICTKKIYHFYLNKFPGSDRHRTLIFIFKIRHQPGYQFHKYGFYLQADADTMKTFLDQKCILDNSLEYQT